MALQESAAVFPHPPSQSSELPSQSSELPSQSSELPSPMSRDRRRATSGARQAGVFFCLIKRGDRFPQGVELRHT